MTGTISAVLLSLMLSASTSFTPFARMPFVERRTALPLGMSELSTTVLEEEQPKLARIQRSYRCYEWEYKNQTYRINYRVEGPELVQDRDEVPQPLLLVHGFGANVNHFRQNFPVLQDAGYRVYAIDLIGFGASEKADVDYSIDLFVDLLHDFVHAMNERYHKHVPVDDISWIVAGNSVGGLCSLGLARALPHQVQGVVLLNTAGGMSGFRYEDVPWLARPILYFVQNYVLKGEWGNKFFNNFKTAQNVKSILSEQGVYKNKDNVDEELLEILLGPSDDEGASNVFLKVFGGDPGPTPESILPDVKCPILALWGEDDPWVPHQRGIELVDYHHDFHLEVLPETGHCPHDDRPDLVHSLMIPWMEKVQERYTPPKLGESVAVIDAESTVINQSNTTDSSSEDTQGEI